MNNICIFLFLILFFPAVAQIEQPARLEIEMDRLDDPFLVLSCDKSGLALVRKNRQQSNLENAFWEVRRVDTALQEVWNEFVVLEPQNLIRGYDYQDGRLYLLFAEDQYSLKNYFLVIMNINTGNHATKVFKMVVDVELSEFEVIGNSAIFGGMVNFRPVVTRYDLQSEKMSVLPGFYKNYSELLQFNMQEQYGRFQVISTERLEDRRYSINIRSFDQEGSRLWEYTVDPESDRSIIHGHVVPMLNGNILLVGTYSDKKSNFSQGLISVEITPEGDQVTNYYNYADLDNFFAYMKAKKRSRVLRKIERRRVKGKEVKFNYRLLVNQIIEREDDYIMLGEAFYPKYSSSSHFMTPPTYGGVPQAAQSFDGYQYTHAVVIGFDRNGKLLWDNSFEINDALTYDLDQLVHAKIDVDKDRLILLYIFENAIRSKIIKEDEVVEGKSSKEIRLSYQDDMLKNSNDQVEKLDYWYGGYFFAHGVQRIKNQEQEDVKVNRQVFFINKINYQ